MKAVLISIQPKWCELIASGKKTVEVRKSRPKIDVPFKCYIYCTSSNIHECLLQNENGTKLIHAINYKTAIPVGGYVGNGKVIGEFVCDRIELFEMEGYDKTDTTYQNIRRIVDEDDDTTAFMEVSNDMSEVEISDSRLLKQSCLSFDDIGEYVAGGKEFGFYDFYGWHISDLVIYDKPKELSEFIVERYPCLTRLKRPPQSWCYIDHPTEKGGGSDA